MHGSAPSKCSASINRCVNLSPYSEISPYFVRTFACLETSQPTLVIKTILKHLGLQDGKKKVKNALLNKTKVSNLNRSNDIS
jgi:hypothetical protein